VRRQNAKIYGLLNSCKAHYLQGNELVLNFASDVIRKRMEEPANLEVTQRAIQQVLQREVTIRCTVDMGKRDSIPSGVDNDGMVAAALRDLGGEIVDMQ
jgi:hypothetical protein